MSNTVFNNGNHILVGLGGTGGKILRAFKMRMFEEFPSQEERDKLAVALLYVDSDREMMPVKGRPRKDCMVLGQDASFKENEFLDIKEQDVDYILDHIDNHPELKGIVHNVRAVKSAIGSLGKAAGQMRRAGRLLFAVNAQKYVSALHNAFARCSKVSGDGDALTIHIFAGLCGGTGSGSIVDALLQARKAYPDAIIIVYAMIPEKHLPKADGEIDKGRYYPNGYAAIRELNAIQVGRFCPHDVTGDGPLNLYKDKRKGVANGLVVYSNMNVNGRQVDSFNELPKIVSDYVFARIFLINNENDACKDIIRAYNFENSEQFAIEYDETVPSDGNNEAVMARTKNVGSFGIKRVVYPEMRVLKHITYTVAEKVLYQFKFGNWSENIGFVNEAPNRDYRTEFLNDDTLGKWKLDLAHLTLEKPVLKNSKDEETFREYWGGLIADNRSIAANAKVPPTELESILNDYFNSTFRTSKKGVAGYYKDAERVLPELSKEIRATVESNLFNLWKEGKVALVEMQTISLLIAERVREMQDTIEAEVKKTEEQYNKDVEDFKFLLEDWSHVLLGRLIGKRNDLYVESQGLLEHIFVGRTYRVALEFAGKLASTLRLELARMDSDLNNFAERFTAAIKATEETITAHRKKNKGLEDMKSAIIEVSEEEKMAEFEADFIHDKNKMHSVTDQMRQAILPNSEFVGFGDLAMRVNVDEICNVFDRQLSAIVKERHASLPVTATKVLGMNILMQLQQKWTTDADINENAYKLIEQSGIFLKIDQNELKIHLPNNEGPLSPDNPASYDNHAILISIPSPKKDAGLVNFAKKLEKAFADAIGASQGGSIVFDMTSPREDEMSIIMVENCVPLRAAEWLSDYKGRYERFLNTGNTTTDTNAAILLHSEGDGKNLPSLFAKSKAEIEKLHKNSPGSTDRAA